jgi:hypothetical protein
MGLYLPWGVVTVARDTHLALFSCDRGHVWTTWCEELAAPDDPGLRCFPISPIRQVHDGDALARLGIRAPTTVLVIDWTGIYAPLPEDGDV